jgi:glycosyltransferase involved in cell wall biosynthesis
MPKVSVLIPSYNHARFLAQTIESVLAQSYHDFELIIIDDGSSDHSREIIQQYSTNDHRIKSWFHEHNQGIASTLNEGLEKALGQYIALLGSDDRWLPQKLATQMTLLENNEDLVVWSEGEIIDATGKATGELFTQRHHATNKRKSGTIFEELLQGNYIFGSSIIVKKENVMNVKFNESLLYLNDFLFEVQLAEHHPFYFISTPLAQYRIHGENVTLKDKEGWERDSLFIHEFFLKKYGSCVSYSVKRILLLRYSVALVPVGENKKALEYVLQAYRIPPFHLRDLKYLLYAVLGGNRILPTFFQQCYLWYTFSKRKIRER